MNARNAALTVLSIALKIVVFAFVAMGLIRLGEMSFDYGHSVFQEEALDPAPGRSITVTLEEGVSTKDLAQMMEEKGLVEDWLRFFIQVKMSKYAETMVPGTYTLTTAMKPRQMMAVMSGEELELEANEEGS